METAIKWFYDRLGRVTYSMTYRNGPSSYDCSSAVYNALITGGLLPSMRIGNTDSMYGDLERNGWVKVGPNAQGNFDTRRGDVFLWGKRGASSGAFGHTGMFVNANDIIHCASGYNGIHVDNYDQIRGWNGYPEQTFYRYVGGGSAPVNPVDQDLEVGSWIVFNPVYTVDDVQLIGGIWQVRTNALCPIDFTWDDNGIPAGPLVEVDNEGYATGDQNLNPGSQYVLPGKFQVLDLGEYKGRWLALIQIDGLKFWVDVETVTEVASNAPDRARPGNRPSVPQAPPTDPITEPEPEKPVDNPTPPVEEPKPVEPETPTEPEKPVEQPPKEETKVAFSQENQKELAVQQAKVLDANTDFTPAISDAAKTRAYFFTDIGIIVSTFAFTTLGLLELINPIVALGLNAALVTALLGVKQTFRLSAKKQQRITIKLIGGSYEL